MILTFIVRNVLPTRGHQMVQVPPVKGLLVLNERESLPQPLDQVMKYPKMKCAQTSVTAILRRESNKLSIKLLAT